MRKNPQCDLHVHRENNSTGLHEKKRVSCMDTDFEGGGQNTYPQGGRRVKTELTENDGKRYGKGERERKWERERDII